MLKTELLNDGTLIKTTSDAGMMIRQDETGILYAEAIDPVNVGRTYTETDIPVDASDDEITDEEAIDIILGGII